MGSAIVVLHGLRDSMEYCESWSAFAPASRVLWSPRFTLDIEHSEPGELQGNVRRIRRPDASKSHVYIQIRDAWSRKMTLMKPLAN